MEFRNTCGMTVEAVLELLEVYIRNTHNGFGEGTFVQTKGVCIGSKVVLALSDIFLGTVDRGSERNLEGVVKKMFRYVDDYLTLGSNTDAEPFKKEGSRYLHSCDKGLSFIQKFLLTIG